MYMIISLSLLYAALPFLCACLYKNNLVEW